MLPTGDHLRSGLHFVCTCPAAPEQYDVYLDGRQVGYVRSRHGHFTVSYPDADGKDLHDGSNDGFASFTDAERGTCLDFAATLIWQELNKA